MRYRQNILTREKPFPTHSLSKWRLAHALCRFIRAFETLGNAWIRQRLQVIIISYRVDLSKYFFSQHITDTWNSLYLPNWMT